MKHIVKQEEPLAFSEWKALACEGMFGEFYTTILYLFGGRART